MQNYNSTKSKNILNRLRILTRPHKQARQIIKHPEIAPPVDVSKSPQLRHTAPAEVLKPKKLSPLSKASLQDQDFLNLQNRLAKRLEANGVKLTPISPASNTAPTRRGGIMDNIGKIFDCGTATPLKHTRIIETA